MSLTQEHAARYAAILEAFAAASRDLEAAFGEAFVADGTSASMAKSVGMVLALSGQTEFKGPGRNALDFEAETRGLNGLLVALSQLGRPEYRASILASLRHVRTVAASRGATDQTGAFIARGDFGPNGLIQFTLGGQTCLAGRWDSLPSDHPARSFVRPDVDLVPVPNCGLCLVLSANIDKPAQVFDLAEVLTLTRGWRSIQESIRSREEDDRRRREQEEEARRRADPLSRLAVVERELADLKAERRPA